MKSLSSTKGCIVIVLTSCRDLQIYHPFGNLPSRTYTDYYQLIKKPVSLKSIMKRTRGQHGREPPTGITDFKTWDAFEEEVSLIWRNAQEYNEDGSEMFNLAEEFKVLYTSYDDGARLTVSCVGTFQDSSR